MTNPAIIVFDVTQFRAQFPAFQNPVMFPTATLQMYWDSATCYVSDTGNYGWLQGDCRRLAINLMTAHLAALSVLIASGQVPYLAQNATIDKVSVGLTPPPLKNQWQWWLMTTPYGMQLQALLQNRSVGGWYVGGRPELSAFRKVGGRFC